MAVKKQTVCATMPMKNAISDLINGQRADLFEQKQ